MRSVETRLNALLRRAKDAGLVIRLWWRDDDACTVTAPLVRLLEMRSLLHVPLSLAVVPRDAQPDLAQAVMSAAETRVLQHGWAHAEQQRTGERKSEFGDHRPVAQMLHELDEGRSTMEAMFGPNFVPVLVPPWNRIGTKITTRRSAVGLPWMSAFGPRNADDAYVVNTHIDIIDWTSRTGLQPQAVLGLLCDEVSRLIEHNSTEPIGLLTHHLQHDEMAWACIEAIMTVLTNNSDIAWPTVSDLFPPTCPARAAV